MLFIYLFFHKEGKMKILLLLIFSYNLFSSSPEGLIKKGNSFYKKGKYNEAMDFYAKARISLPTEVGLNYNIGNIHYKKGEYDKAVEAYQKAVESKDETLREMAYYNIGNCYFQKEDFLNAIEFYKKALNLNPKDEDAKINLELARKKLKDQAKKEKQEQNEKQMQKKEEKQMSEEEKKKNDQKKKEAENIMKAVEDKEKEVKDKQKQKIQGNSSVEVDW